MTKAPTSAGLHCASRGHKTTPGRGRVTHNIKPGCEDLAARVLRRVAQFYRCDSFADVQAQEGGSLAFAAPICIHCAAIDLRSAIRSALYAELGFDLDGATDETREIALREYVKHWPFLPGERTELVTA